MIIMTITVVDVILYHI